MGEHDTNNTEAHEFRLKRVEQKIDILSTMIHSIDVSMAVLKTQFTQSTCSAPNLCLTLKQNLTELERDLGQRLEENHNAVVELEKIRSYSSGALKTVMIVGAFVCSIVGGVVTAFVIKNLA